MGHATHAQKTTSSRGNVEKFPLVTQILSISIGFVGFVLSAVAVSGCDFFEVSSFWVFGSVSVGLFQYEMVSIDGLLAVVAGYGDIGDIKISSVGCQEYQGNPPQVDSIINATTIYQAADVISGDASFKAAKAFGVIAAFLSGLLTILALVMLIARLPRWLFKTMSGTYFFCFIAQLLTFLVLNNEICTGSVNDTVLKLTKDFDLGLNCSISTRGYCSIFASISFLILGILIVVCPTPKVHLLRGINCCGDKRGACEMSKKTETRNPDGSITIKEEKQNPDGTRSVTIKTKHIRCAEV